MGEHSGASGGNRVCKTLSEDEKLRRRRGSHAARGQHDVRVTTPFESLFIVFLWSLSLMAPLFVFTDIGEQVSRDYKDCFVVALAFNSVVTAMAVAVVVMSVRGWNELRELPLAVMKAERRKENFVSVSLPVLACASMAASMLAVAAAGAGGDYFRVVLAQLMFVVSCVVAVLPPIPLRTGLGRVIPYAKVIDRLSWFFLTASENGGRKKGDGPGGRKREGLGVPDVPHRRAGLLLLVGIASLVLCMVVLVLCALFPENTSPLVALLVVVLMVLSLAVSSFSFAMASWVFRRVTGNIDDCLIALLFWAVSGVGALSVLIYGASSSLPPVSGLLRGEGWGEVGLGSLIPCGAVLAWLVLLWLEVSMVAFGANARIWRVGWMASQMEWGRQSLVEQGVEQAEGIRTEEKGGELLRRINSEVQASPRMNVRSRESKVRRKECAVARAIEAVEAARKGSEASEGQGLQESHATGTGVKNVSQPEPEPVTLAVPLTEPLQGELRLSLTVSYQGVGQAGPAVATSATSAASAGSSSQESGRAPLWRRWLKARRRR